MNNIFMSVVLSYLTDFFGIGIGFLCAFLMMKIKTRTNAYLSFVLEFSSGLMLAVVTFSLIPDAINKCGTAYTVFGIITGLFIVHLIGKMLSFGNKNTKKSLLLLFNLWLHNIPEGFVLGSSGAVNMEIMLILFSAILLHNIPQGFLISLPLVEKGSLKWIFTVMILSGIPTAVGALAGVLAGGINLFGTGLMLSIAAGSMLYVLIFELSYEAHKIYERKITEVFYILGLIFGILMLR